MTPGRAVLVALMDRYIRVLLDPFITRLEVHKLMYFMQVAGQPRQVRSWNRRKHQFTERQLKIAADRLSQGGWIDSSCLAVR